MLVSINVDLVCRIFRGGIINFEEVMIFLCLLIGYQPHICPKDLILVQKVSFLEIEHFDLLYFSKNCIISCQPIHQKLYINVIVKPFYESFA